MPNVFNQLLGALSGGATGYGQQQDKKKADARQAQNDLYLNEDRASQRALREAEAYKLAHPTPRYTTVQTDQGLVRVPEDGPPGPITGPNGEAYGKPDKPPQYDATRGGFVSPDGPFKPISGLPAIPDKTPPQLVTGTGPDGKPTYGVFDKRTRTIQPVDDAGMTPKVPGGGAQVQKELAFVGLMDNALPTMGRLGAKVRPWAISGALKNPTVGNVVLNDDEREYLTAARNYLAGALHLESGARLTDSQIEWGQSRFLPTLGDNPKNIMDKYRSAAQTARDRAGIAHGSAGAPSAQSPAPSAAPPGQPVTKPKTGNIFLDDND